MSGFGDADPEDAYDDSDPIDDKLQTLGRVLEALAHAPRSARTLTRLAWARHKLDELTGDG